MYKNIFKNIIDRITSLIFLLILSPILLIITILLFIVNNGIPFFFQERVGKNEKFFKIIKFKTMNDDKDENGKLLQDKDRITIVGKFIRKTSLDEIPQLFNILKGDMSFVGPRPLFVKYLPYYNEFEKQRHLVKPGITGLSQINGRNMILWDERIRLDIEYTKNISFLIDIKIITKTILNVIKQKDIVVVPSEMGRVSLDVRRDPKNAGKYDNNGFLIQE
jgi:lipopolysaccharide/colanic/teichoic acid biosynthesis glycosyltransferase